MFSDNWLNSGILGSRCHCRTVKKTISNMFLWKLKMKLSHDSLSSGLVPNVELEVFYAT